jgi:arylsulfatase A-like enzyme
LRDAYDQTLAYLDSQLGVLLNELERRQLLANTVVVVTSDHGEAFGEHGLVGHGNGLYLPVLHVPLLISFPRRIPEGKVVAEAVTLVDLPATVLDLVGLGGRVDFPGHSFSYRWGSTTNLLRTPQSPVVSEVSVVPNAPTWHAVARVNLKSIIVGKHHYIRHGDGREELFDIIADPWEALDLVGSENGEAILTVTRAALDSALRASRGAVAQDQTR